MTDKRRAAIGEATTSCYALRFLRRFATGILEIGSRSERNVATIDKRGARNVGMTARGARRSGRRPRVVTPCGSCGRFATGSLEIGSRSQRNARDDPQRGAKRNDASGRAASRSATAIGIE